MNLRELRAVEIAARAKIPFRDGAWIVPAQSSSGSYRVTIGPQPFCSCDDFQLRKLPCKHILAARLVCAREHDGEPPELVTDAVPKKPAYRQNWPVYNEVQQTEKQRFQKLLFELCRGLPNVEQVGSGRRWTPMADMVFACALKVFTTVSARRFACDLRALALFRVALGVISRYSSEPSHSIACSSVSRRAGSSRTASSEPAARTLVSCFVLQTLTGMSFSRVFSPTTMPA